MGTQRLQGLALDLLVFGHGLNHQVALREQGETSAGADTVERCPPSGLRDFTLRDLVVQIVSHVGSGPLQRLGADVDQIDVKARHGADMGNPAANLAGSNDTDFPDSDRLCCCYGPAVFCFSTQLTTSIDVSSSAVLHSIMPPMAGWSQSARYSGLYITAKYVHHVEPSFTTPRKRHEQCLIHRLAKESIKTR